MKIIYYVLTLLFSVLIATNTNFYSPSDDHLFYEALQSGVWCGIVNGHCGRFFPLHGLDFFVCAGNIFLVYSLAGLIFFECVRRMKNVIPTNMHWGFYVGMLLIIFSPAVTSNFFRIPCQERWILLFVVILTDISIRNRSYVLPFTKTVVLACLIIFSKEPGILAMFLFGLSIIIKNILNGEIENRRFDFKLGFTIIGCSLIAIVLWLIFVVPSMWSRYGENNIPVLLNFIKSLIEWILTDPFLFVLFVPLCIYRVLIVYKNKGMTIYDCLAVAGLGYMATFFLTRIGYAQHYLTPVYGIAIIYVAHLLHGKQFLRIKFFKIASICCLLLMIKNIPSGINDILFQRYNNRNFGSVISTLNKIIDSSSEKRVNFFILGGQDWGDNMFASGLVPFILDKGHSPEQFDFLSYEVSPTPRKPDWDVPFTFMDTRIISTPVRGDYILVTPYTNEQYRTPPNGAVLLYEWSAPKQLPSFEIMDVIRYICVRLNIFSDYIRNKKTGMLKAHYLLYQIK